jgi:Ser/Thr protein kinase RdoA (MazF antagonist)
MKAMKHDIGLIAPQFQIHGELVSAAPYGSGHINDTYAAVYFQGGATVRYVHQRINTNIFKDPVSLMNNIARVTEHQRRKLIAAGASEISRRALTLVPARDGKPFYRDAEGNYWRTYVFIEKATTFDAVQSAQQAFEAAKTFGQFQQMLTDLPGPRLHEPIVDFHNTAKRFHNLEKAIEADACNRAKSCQADIEFALRRKSSVGVIVDGMRNGDIPERVTHNDTKLNNVMIDDASGEGICVIDLDSVMPGSALYDFGDMVRTATSPALEDEKDLSKVTMQMPMFEALARGYLSTAGQFLTKAEKRLITFSGKLITFECGIRFLTDYLSGDTYFKVHRDGHNLDRCRTQFKLVASIEQQEDAMQEFVERL